MVNLPPQSSGILDKDNHSYIQDYPVSKTEDHFDYFVAVTKDTDHTNSIRRQIDLIGNYRNPEEEWLHSPLGILERHNSHYGPDGTIEQKYSPSFCEGEPFYTKIVARMPPTRT